MPTLLLPPRMTPDSVAIGEAALATGWRVERLPNWRPPDVLRHSDLTLYGEPLFADVVSGPLDIALIEPTADWLPRVAPEYLLREVRIATLAGAQRLTAPAFVKPAQEKAFPAGVFSSGAELPPAASELLPDTPVLIAEPLRWLIEYRCFVLERALATMSPYIRDGDLARDADGAWPAPPDERAEAEAFLTTVLADSRVPLPPAIVVDVGLIEGRGWAVVEANAAWGAGICGCDPRRILPILRRATLRRDAIPAADTPWLRPFVEVEG